MYIIILKNLYHFFLKKMDQKKRKTRKNNIKMSFVNKTIQFLLNVLFYKISKNSSASSSPLPIFRQPSNSQHSISANLKIYV